MVDMAIQIAESCNEQYFTCRFITVDTDIEHNESVLQFYRKNGFIPNEETVNKRRKKSVCVGIFCLGVDRDFNDLEGIK
jgi:4-hydroxy-3-methylbut-2-enyl diphosphate reductase IspH